MSKLITNTIRHTGGSADNITLDNSQNVTAEGNLTVDGNLTVSGATTISGYNTTSSRNNRNLIINGAMQVNQRISTSGLDDFNVVTGTMYTLDRWRAVGSSNFDWDSARVKQVSDSPDEFSNSLRVDIGNTETPSGGQNGLIHQYIEAQHLQHLAYGTSSAKTCTLSFWVRSNKTGTYCAQISHHDAGKYLMYEYSISSANTWEKKTITFSGNTSDAISNDTGIGLEISFLLTSGSDDHVSATTSWTAKPGGGGGSKYLATSNQVNLWDHADNVWYLTGVQLEVGSVATDFEHRAYVDELARCQRYFYGINNVDSQFRGIGYGGGPNWANAVIYFPTTMRAAPTGSGSNLDTLYFNNGATAWSNSSLTFNTCKYSTAFGADMSGSSQGQGLSIYSTGSTLRLNFEAEL